MVFHLFAPQLPYARFCFLLLSTMSNSPSILLVITDVVLDTLAYFPHGAVGTQTVSGPDFWHEVDKLN